MDKYIKPLIAFAILIMVVTISGCAQQPTEETTTTERERPRIRETTTTQIPTTERPTTTTERATTTSVSQEELKSRYAQQILPLLERLDVVFNEVDSIVDDVINEVITPEEGADRIRVQRDEVADIRAEAVGITPPLDLEDAHSHFLNGLDLLIDSYDQLALGLDTQNPASIDNAIRLLEEAGSEFDAFAAELEENLSMQSAGTFDKWLKLNKSLNKTTDSLLKDLPEIKRQLD